MPPQIGEHEELWGLAFSNLTALRKIRGRTLDHSPQFWRHPTIPHAPHIDAIIDRSQRILDGVANGSVPEVSPRPSLAVGDLLIHDPDWDERERLSQWRSVLTSVGALPPVLAAGLVYDAWESLEPMQRQYWLGGQFVVAYLRSSGKVTSHLPAFNVGLKAVPRERRRARDRMTRLLAFLEAMSVAAKAGVKEIVRLNQARDQMERRLRGRRSSSRLPAVIDLILSRPIVSAAMIAEAAGVTPRGALNLIGELGAREMTGRGRYRAWGVLWSCIACEYIISAIFPPNLDISDNPYYLHAKRTWS